ncbi:MAG TPA: AAA family ATPase [Candidatus Moranbacteria bacterium]|nr:AAA family ATPase [Candidatus Moranbacteria bacterium]
MAKVILGLAGEIASGKGTTAKYICDKYNGSAHRFSTMLRDVAKRLYLEENRENLQKISTVFRENFFDDILSSVIAKDVENDKHEIIAIDGVRRMADISYLKRLPNFKLVYIDTSIENSFGRLTQRGENMDDKDKTFEEFKKDHEREAELQIRDLKEKADYVIDNNGTTEELYRQIDEIINK